MIEVKRYLKLPEVIDQAVLSSWRDKLRSKFKHNSTLSPELIQFIDAAADQMSDFGQIRQVMTLLPGSDLLLCGMKELKGERIDPWTMYPTPVPYMVAVDHRTWMQRLYIRRGKQALVDFVKANANPVAVPKLLEILNVHVFHEERPAFKKLSEIIKADSQRTTPDSYRDHNKKKGVAV